MFGHDELEAGHVFLCEIQQQHERSGRSKMMLSWLRSNRAGNALNSASKVRMYCDICDEILLTIEVNRSLLSSARFNENTIRTANATVGNGQ